VLRMWVTGAGGEGSNRTSSEMYFSKEISSWEKVNTENK
jgi:hypothetical protein